jgi:hypothetical protein
MKSAKEKLDEKLGIKDITEIFNQNDIDAILKDSKIEIDKIDNKIKNKAKEIDTKIDTNKELITTCPATVQLTNNKIYDLEESLSEISFLVNKSRDIITNLYTYITNTDFVDPDIISSTAKMIEASRIVISDYLELYKEKLRMIHSFNMEIQKHKNKLELEEHKAALKLKYALKDKPIDTKSRDMVPYIQEQVVQLMKNSETI